jgi:hypothetical protein
MEHIYKKLRARLDEPATGYPESESLDSGTPMNPNFGMSTAGFLTKPSRGPRACIRARNSIPDKPMTCNWH